jgi:acyl-CoA dehydrogenase
MTSQEMDAGKVTMRADELLVETIDKLFAEHCTPERITAAEGAYDQALWATLEDNGLTLVGVPEQHGGSGGTLHDVAAIITASGYHAAPVPLADSLVGARLLAAGGREIGSGPHIVIAATRVPWFEQATLSAEVGVQVDPARETVRVGHNYAGEPYVVLRSIPRDVANAREQMALARSLQMAGALQRVAELCVQYAMEREQFGKPIGKQQILQHYLAQIAGDAVTAQAAADNAIDLIVAGVSDAEITLAIAAAKTVAGRAVGSVNRLAHQLHGAIGYTDEHRLQFWTRRLWAWRDDFGTETEWAAVVGRAFAVQGGDALWPMITSWPRAHG